MAIVSALKRTVDEEAFDSSWKMMERQSDTSRSKFQSRFGHKILKTSIDGSYVRLHGNGPTQTQHQNSHGKIKVHRSLMDIEDGKEKSDTGNVMAQAGQRMIGGTRVVRPQMEVPSARSFQQPQVFQQQPQVLRPQMLQPQVSQPQVLQQTYYQQPQVMQTQSIYQQQPQSYNNYQQPVPSSYVSQQYYYQPQQGETTQNQQYRRPSLSDLKQVVQHNGSNSYSAIHSGEIPMKNVDPAVNSHHPNEDDDVPGNYYYQEEQAEEEAEVEEAKAKDVPREKVNERLIKTEKDQLFYSKKHRHVSYKPCTTKEYLRNKPKEYYELGKLNPDLNTEELAEKRAKQERMKAYSRKWRSINASASSKTEPEHRNVYRGSGTTTTNNNNNNSKDVQQQRDLAMKRRQAQSARQRGLEFAKTVPRPRVRSSSASFPKSDSENHDQLPVSELDRLEMNHERAKAEIEAIKREFGM